MEILSIENLKFRYPKSDKWVLDGLSLRVKQGEFVVLSGSTGCGKTTLFKLIKKELTPAGEEIGKVVFRGKDKEELSLRESAEGIGFVMQDPENQIVTEKVLRELSFYMENLGYAPAVIAARVGELSNYFGITPWIGKDTFHLSGGQKQLLTLASVMTVFPDLLILDEPTSRLDPIAAGEFIATLKRINTELGITVLLCEHRLEEVLPIADKFAYMEDGKISYFGEPREVCRALAERSAEEFLPAATRIWYLTRKKGEPPLSVKDGKNYVGENFSAKKLPLPQTEKGKELLRMTNV
ncbi:MAG: ABC transporter ATP-binding protein, partial [Clostridia bacterium]|nr:ABC transporter ATP-binding protein [Clostridia bacterium]